MTQKSSGYIKQESTQQKGDIPPGHRRAVILKYIDPLTGKAHTTNHQPGKTADKKHRERDKKEKVGGQSKVGQPAYKSRHTPIASGMFQKWYKTNRAREHPAER